MFSAPAGGDPVWISWRCLVLIKLESWATVRWKSYDHNVSRFHLILERYGRTDGRTDRRTDWLICCININIARQYADARIKTVESAEYTCQSQQCNSTNSAAILRMEIKHVAAYYFLRTIMWRVDLRGLYAMYVALRVEQPFMLNRFFRITIFCRVRACEQKVCGWGLKIRQILSLFGPPCTLRMTRKKIQVVTSLMTLKIHHV